nr:MAG TPA: RNA polymerase sigma factor [Caudoviricetes sp.]
MRFRLGYSCDRVGFEVSYEKSSVYNYLKKIKDELTTRINRIEQEVFHSDN